MDRTLAALAGPGFLGWLLLAGCGRLGFEPLGAVADGGPVVPGEAGPDHDAGPPGALDAAMLCSDACAWGCAGELCDTPVDLAGGDNHACMVLASGRAMCWGDNTAGQLGDGSTTDSLAPVPVEGISDAVAVVVGTAHSCVQHATGQVSCWGSNRQASLGDGTDIDRPVPGLVLDVADAVAIDAGGDTTCVALAGGQVMCWGSLTSEQYLGCTDGFLLVGKSTPVAIAGVAEAVSVTVGRLHQCAVDVAGQAYCWGYNACGELGDGTMDLRLDAVAVSGLTDARAIAAGENHTCAVRVTNDVVCWGTNTAGQLGSGTEGQALEPVPAAALSPAIDVVAGSFHTCVLRDTGAVTCRGDNASGQLGQGAGGADADVDGVSDVQALHESSYGGLVVLPSGQVAAWGLNDDGQLGDRSTMDSAKPVIVAPP